MADPDLSMLLRHILAGRPDPIKLERITELVREHGGTAPTAGVLRRTLGSLRPRLERHVGSDGVERWAMPHDDRLEHLLRLALDASSAPIGVSALAERIGRAAGPTSARELAEVLNRPGFRRVGRGKYVLDDGDDEAPEIDTDHCYTLLAERGRAVRSATLANAHGVAEYALDDALRDDPRFAADPRPAWGLACWSGTVRALLEPDGADELVSPVLAAHRALRDGSLRIRSASEIARKIHYPTGLVDAALANHVRVFEAVQRRNTSRGIRTRFRLTHAAHDALLVAADELPPAPGWDGILAREDGTDDDHGGAYRAGATLEGNVQAALRHLGRPATAEEIVAALRAEGWTPPPHAGRLIQRVLDRNDGQLFRRVDRGYALREPRLAS